MEAGGLKVGVKVIMVGPLLTGDPSHKLFQCFPSRPPSLQQPRGVVCLCWRSGLWGQNFGLIMNTRRPGWLLRETLETAHSDGLRDFPTRRRGQRHDSALRVSQTPVPALCGSPTGTLPLPPPKAKAGQKHIWLAVRPLKTKTARSSGIGGWPRTESRLSNRGTRNQQSVSAFKPLAIHPFAWFWMDLGDRSLQPTGTRSYISSGGEVRHRVRCRSRRVGRSNGRLQGRAELVHDASRFSLVDLSGPASEKP